MIRTIEEQDYQAVYQLGETFQKNFQSIYPLNELCPQEYFHVLVYEEKNQIIGFLIYTDLYLTVDILDIVIEKTHRNQKIGTNLLDYMITSLDPKSTIYLEVATYNQYAIALYEKFGFKKIHTRKEYYGLTDAYIMERKLMNE